MNHKYGPRAKILNPGQKFRMLTVIELIGSKPGRGLLYRCRCDCGKECREFGPMLRFRRVSCGCYQPAHRKGKDHPKWTGGRYVAPNGYVYVAAHGHANANKHNYALEHVIVMSKRLGRPLAKGESVHHRNGVRHDNRIANLELWFSAAHPPGQRVPELVDYAIEILKRYAPERLHV